MRKERFTIIALAIGVLLSAAGWAEEASADAALERICGWVGDEDGLPTEVLAGLAAADREGESGPVPGCGAAGACLLEARGSQDGAQDTGADRSPAAEAAVCARLTEVAALSQAQLRELLAEVEDRPQVADRPGLAGCAVFLRCLLAAEPEAPAGGDPSGSWKAEFERLCAQTEVATTLPTEQLQQLIRDCDRLLERLADLTGPEVRVGVFRLKKCRAFFEYALQLRDEGSSP
jgi:hypothetical protein